MALSYIQPLHERIAKNPTILCKENKVKTLTEKDYFHL